MKTRSYETTFIVNAALEDPAIEAIVNSTTDFLQNHGATITAKDIWGRKRLAYPINKKNNGYYAHFTFNGPNSLIPALERFFFLEENIIRHLTLELSAKAIEYRASHVPQDITTTGEEPTLLAKKEDEVAAVDAE